MNWLRNVKVPTQLFVTFFNIIILFALSGSIGLNTTNIIQKHLRDICTLSFPSTNHLLELDRNLQKALLAARSIIVTDQESGDFALLHEEYDSKLRDAEEVWKKYKNLPHTLDEK